MRSLVLLFINLILLTGPRNANAQEERDALTAYLNDVRTNRPLSMPAPGSVDPHAGLATLRQFADDSVSAVRIRVCEVAHKIARQSRDSTIRQAAVDIIAHTCLYSTTDVQGVSLTYLRSFPRADFSTIAQENIRSMVTSGHPYLKEVIRLSAFLQMKELMPRIKSMTTQEAQPAVRWTAIISLARLGDDRAAQLMMARVRRLPLNDELVYSVFPDLIFSRHREAISYLIDALNSDALNCMSADADRDIAIPCAYRVMEQLAGVIKDYPLPVDGSGDIDTPDYPQALTQVREWFRAHKTFAIDYETY